MAMLAMLVLTTGAMQAQSTDTTAKTTKKAKATKSKAAKAEKPGPTAAESEERMAIEQLQEKAASQQADIDALKAANAAKDAALSAAQSTAASAQAAAAAATDQATAATAAAQAQAATVTGLKSTVTDLQNANVGLATTISTTKSDLNDAINSPAALHYKGITITPVAFFAFENVWRERSVNSDINTPFNTIPMPSAPQGHVSELNFSGRQSRVGALFQGDAGSYKLSGYVEADFLGSGTTSNGNQSNSYVLRQRQIWGQAATSKGFTVTGGQMWSLVTETGKGTDNRTEKLPNAVDAQYTVGFNWARQPSVRFQQRWGDYKTGAFTAAVSLENAQITNFAATSATAGAVPTNFFFAGAGQNGGLYNAFNGTYANNVAPDLIVKGVWDMAIMHVELGGIARFLRDFYYPITGENSGGTGYTLQAAYVSNTKSAGGVFGSVRVSPNKYADIAVQAMAGTGTGRYGSSQLADATLRPDGTLEPIRNYHGLFTLETHPTPKLDVYAYYGGEYAQRTVYTVTAAGALAGSLMGYGARNLNDSGCYALPANPASSTGGSPSAPSSCASPTRYIQEGMIGFTYRIVNTPKFGRLQYQVNYQYVQKNLWSGAPGSSGFPSGPRGLDNMFLTSLRYYIP
jgi:hypothetical protein